MHPLLFNSPTPPPKSPQHAYLHDPAAHALFTFFTAKDLPALKDEDRREQWYDDWLTYQSSHGLYAALLSPQKYSSRGAHFDLLRYARFLELFAYFSPAHGYSLQVTFLGLFSVLLGSNESLKQEAVAALEAGRLLAFAVSEQAHGSDLLANTFSVTQSSPTTFIANGQKYYIGNANVASLISILAHKSRPADADSSNRPGRQPILLLALRPPSAPAFSNVTKIPTLGVRSAFVGSFEVHNHAFPDSDIIAEGRDAWDSVFGTVTLGKFFLGFGSIGICQHAFHEALTHLRTRILYGQPVLDMPHIRSAMIQAFTRLTAMKLFAYRALDYIHTASPTDRRYLLFCAVQKARVSTEAVKVMALLSECVGAKGFEGHTYLEMALRDAQLIPGLEGSMHINLRLTTQFLPRYFDNFDPTLPPPPSLIANPTLSRENPYLTETRTGHTRSIAFTPFLTAYRPFTHIPAAMQFARQAAAFRRFLHHIPPGTRADTQIDIAIGHCTATIAYAQLIAENAHLLTFPTEILSLIFTTLVTDLSERALHLATLPHFTGPLRARILRILKAPQSRPADSAFAYQWMTSPA